MTARPEASVIICAHNPRENYLRRVIEALRQQTLCTNNWELLLVDSASNPPLAAKWDIRWHPNARHIREEELGLAVARRRGMREAAADLLIFVDDDNVLGQNYILDAVAVKREWPRLGVWGSGALIPEFESKPRECVTPLLGYLALRQMSSPHWSNVFRCVPSMPWGAGMCVRAGVATAYCEYSQNSSIQIADRRGRDSLMSGGDLEICRVACKIGLGMATFPELRITHLIPKERVALGYLLKIVEGTDASNMLLDYKWSGQIPKSPLRLRGLLSMIYTLIAHPGLDSVVIFRMHLANIRATLRAKRIIAESQTQSA
jgi:glycosyltransferase involved in cell wall biosynthesis